MIKPFAILEPVRHHLERELSRIQAVKIRDIRKEIDDRQYISLAELSSDSERFRDEITRLIVIREAVAKLEALVPTEVDRLSLKEMMLDKANLEMLGRIIRDEPHLWRGLASQCPDVINMLTIYCLNVLVEHSSEPQPFCVIALDAIFASGNQQIIREHLEKVISKIQISPELLNAFIYYTFKVLRENDAIQLLKASKDISEKDKSNDIGTKRRVRVQLSTALHWAILNRAKNIGQRQVFSVKSSSGQYSQWFACSSYAAIL